MSEDKHEWGEIPIPNELRSLPRLPSWDLVLIENACEDDSVKIIKKLHGSDVQWLQSYATMLNDNAPEYAPKLYVNVIDKFVHHHDNVYDIWVVGDKYVYHDCIDVDRVLYDSRTQA